MRPQSSKKRIWPFVLTRAAEPEPNVGVTGVGCFPGEAFGIGAVTSFVSQLGESIQGTGRAAVSCFPCKTFGFSAVAGFLSKLGKSKQGASAAASVVQLSEPLGFYTVAGLLPEFGKRVKGAMVASCSGFTKQGFRLFALPTLRPYLAEMSQGTSEGP
jgi:hypothetical protein